MSERELRRIEVLSEVLAQHRVRCGSEAASINHFSMGTVSLRSGRTAHPISQDQSADQSLAKLYECMKDGGFTRSKLGIWRDRELDDLSSTGDVR